MRLIPYQFQPEGEFLELVEVGDLHYGSSTFLPKKAERHRQYILDSPDRKVIDLGDSIENALKTSPGASVYHQTCAPREQRKWIQEYYRPMRDRVLGIVASNHPDRSDKEADINPDEFLVAFLDCPWIRWEAILSITVGDSRRGQNYTIYVRHAISNSSKPHIVLGAMINQSRAVQGCDVYAYGHNHMFLTTTLPMQIPDPRHGKVKVKDQLFIMGDSFMERDASYAEQHNYPLANEGQFALRLYKNRHEIGVKRLLYR